MLWLLVQSCCLEMWLQHLDNSCDYLKHSENKKSYDLSTKRSSTVYNGNIAKLNTLTSKTYSKRQIWQDSYTLIWFTVLPRPRHPLRSQPGVSVGNSSVSRHQQITFRATLIFHLVDGLLCTTAAHEVRRAGVLTCESCHLERSARPHPHRGWSCQVPKTAEITLF